MKLHFSFFRSSVSRTLTDIRDGRHDVQNCQHNCKENGRIFKHFPHGCTYQRLAIKNLMQYKNINVETLPPQMWSQDDEKAMKVVDFDFKSDLAKGRERELEMGLRTDDDIKEVVTSLEQV